ncbi:MAG: carbohydrate kinase [Proteobacteria bacterium]|nr:carbohydrate kinase [Pseudomonadota bacterium]
MPQGRTLGGAPANFTFQVNELGGSGLLVSRVGDDDLGREALALLDARGVDTAHVAVDPRHPSGTVLAELDPEGKATYRFPSDVAWDFMEASPALAALASQVDCVCFGSLAQRSAISSAAVQAFVQATPPEALRIFDVNLRGDMYSRQVIEASLGLATALKLSDEELPVLARMFGLEGEEGTVLRALLTAHDLDLVAYTCGGAGSLLLTRDQEHRQPAMKVQVVDTIGAGDAFTSALALGLLAGHDLTAINHHASAVAAAVCSMSGGMPPLPDALRLFA